MINNEDDLGSQTCFTLFAFAVQKEYQDRIFHFNMQINSYALCTLFLAPFNYTTDWAFCEHSLNTNALLHLVRCVARNWRRPAAAVVVVVGAQHQVENSAFATRNQVDSIIIDLFIRVQKSRSNYFYYNFAQYYLRAVGGPRSTLQSPAESERGRWSTWRFFWPKRNVLPFVVPP